MGLPDSVGQTHGVKRGMYSTLKGLNMVWLTTIQQGWKSVFRKMFLMLYFFRGYFLPELFEKINGDRKIDEHTYDVVQGSDKRSGCYGRINFYPVQHKRYKRSEQ